MTIDAIKPAIGEPPAVQFIAVDRLQIDPGYQRSTSSQGSKRLIEAMAERWDWRLCVPLLVSARGGDLFIIDGQHRWHGARARGDIAFLPCAVGTFGNAREEAALFVAANRKRVPMTQVDLFRAAVAAGDEVAVRTQQLLEEAGLVLATGGGASAVPGEINCPRALLSLAEKDAEALGAALKALAKAFEGQVVASAAVFLRAMVHALARHPYLSIGDLAAALKVRTPDKWMLLPAVRDALGSARELELRRAIESEFVLPARAAPPEPSAPLSTVPMAAPVPTPLKPAERAWCEQCDQFRSGAQAAACRSTFCKLKVAAWAASA